VVVAPAVALLSWAGMMSVVAVCTSHSGTVVAPAAPVVVPVAALAVLYLVVRWEARQAVVVLPVALELGMSALAKPIAGSHSQHGVLSRFQAVVAGCHRFAPAGTCPDGQKAKRRPRQPTSAPHLEQPFLPGTGCSQPKWTQP
jgi:hypothetical protein